MTLTGLPHRDIAPKMPLMFLLKIFSLVKDIKKIPVKGILMILI